MKKVKIGLGVFLAVVLIGSFFFTTAHAQQNPYPDLSIWLKQWFKLSVIFQELHFSNIGVPPSPGQEVERWPGYLVCTSLNPTPYDPKISPIFSCNIYGPNPDGSWGVDQMSINYVAGDVSNFAGWAELTVPGMLANAFTIQINGKQKKDGTFTGATIKTLGGYRWELDDLPGSTERWVGSIRFSGTWVNPKTLCKPAKNSTLPPCYITP